MEGDSVGIYLCLRFPVDETETEGNSSARTGVGQGSERKPKSIDRGEDITDLLSATGSW